MPSINMSPNQQFIGLTGTSKDDHIKIQHQADSQLKVSVNDESQSFDPGTDQVIQG